MFGRLVARGRVRAVVTGEPEVLRLAATVEMLDGKPIEVWAHTTDLPASGFPVTRRERGAKPEVLPIHRLASVCYHDTWSWRPGPDTSTVVIELVNGMQIRTCRDDAFGPAGDGLSLRAWSPAQKRLARFLIPYHRLREPALHGGSWPAVESPAAEVASEPAAATAPSDVPEWAVTGARAGREASRGAASAASAALVGGVPEAASGPVPAVAEVSPGLAAAGAESVSEEAPRRRRGTATAVTGRRPSRSRRGGAPAQAVDVARTETPTLIDGPGITTEVQEAAAAVITGDLAMVAAAVSAPDPDITDSPDALLERVAALAPKYQRRLAETRDDGLSSRDPERFRKAVQTLVPEIAREDGVVSGTPLMEAIVDRILQNALGFGPLDPLLADGRVTEIMVNGPNRVYVERDGVLELTGVRFEDDGHLVAVIRRMVSQVGRRIDESSPMVDARLLDGSRLNAVLPPAALQGPTLTIRRFARSVRTLEHLVDNGTLSADMAAYLRDSVLQRRNILVSGGTGSGKTTMLNALASIVPGRERLITIEDAAELQIDHPHVVSLEYRPPNVEGRGELTIRHLLRNSLRMRPDRIVVGEVRGPEAIDMLQAMNTGHEGSMSTIHANSARDGFARLETMVVASSVDLPLTAVRQQISSAIQVVVHQRRLADGSRRVIQIAELMGIDDQGPRLRDVFVYREGRFVRYNEGRAA